MKEFVFSFRGFYWDYWRNVLTNELIKFEMGKDPNEYLPTSPVERGVKKE